MGGTGGVFSRLTPEQVRQRMREQERRSDPQFEADVSGFLDKLLARYNSRNGEAIESHLSELKHAIQSLLEDSVDLVFGGSIAKHTYVDGLSDVDTLVLLKDRDLAAQSPSAVLREFAKAIRQRFPNTQTEAGRLAVTVTFSDGHQIQLLPAVRSGEACRIPSADGTSWSRIDPRSFAQTLTEANAAAGTKLVPTIKLAKAINDSFPEDHRLTGYHIESLALDAFRGYSGPKNTKAMLSRFFAAASERVTRPIADPTGQSSHVDEYLGPADSPQRLTASANLLRTARRIKNADGARSLGQWKALFGELA